tara:strand:- start:1366 stop:1701 length:336 start_codon:yes stop_codon:yes gene_type:complete
MMKAQTKGKIYESEEDRIRYEDLYSKAWCAQNRIDVSEKPHLRGQIKVKIWSEKEEDKKNKKENLPPLSSKNAKMINSFLNRKMEIPKIAEFMFSTETFVRNIIKKYKLPR